MKSSKISEAFQRFAFAGGTDVKLFDSIVNSREDYPRPTTKKLRKVRRTKGFELVERSEPIHVSKMTRKFIRSGKLC